MTTSKDKKVPRKGGRKGGGGGGGKTEEEKLNEIQGPTEQNPKFPE